MGAIYRGIMSSSAADQLASRSMQHGSRADAAHPGHVSRANGCIPMRRTLHRRLPQTSAKNATE